MQRVFNRGVKLLQRTRTLRADVNSRYEYLRANLAEVTLERAEVPTYFCRKSTAPRTHTEHCPLQIVKRTFPLALDLGCGKGHFRNKLAGHSTGVETLVEYDEVGTQSSSLRSFALLDSSFSSLQYTAP
jgi:tRNA G46 methylase TrmB